MRVFLLSLVLLVSSCASLVQVEYDEKTDFSEYASFNFYPSLESGLPETENEYVIQILDSLMQQKGFIKSETPRLYVNFFVTETEFSDQNGYYLEQELIVDFVDVAKDRLAWQGVINGRFEDGVSLQQLWNYYGLLIEKILNEYPPKS